MIVAADKGPDAPEPAAVPPPADPLDHELSVLRVVIEALTSLPSEERSRVIGYVIRRFPNPERHTGSALMSQQAYQGAGLHRG